MPIKSHPGPKAANAALKDPTAELLTNTFSLLWRVCRFEKAETANKEYFMPPLCPKSENKSFNHFVLVI